MAEMSPQAQAVLDAAYKRMDDNPHNEVEATLAAALRAAADEVVPSPRLPYDSCCDVSAAAIRAELLAIAIELEAQ
jgi:hypothetical protein